MSNHYDQFMNGYHWCPSTCYIDGDHLQVDEDKQQDEKMVETNDRFCTKCKMQPAGAQLNLKQIKDEDKQQDEEIFCTECKMQPAGAQITCVSRPLSHTPVDTLLSSTSSSPAAASSSVPKPRKTKQKKKKSHSDSRLCGISQDVLEVVKQKGVTSFDEVTDEMFRRLPKDGSNEENRKKNVRRRVYDILNVLVAMDIVSKDRREITWVGLPSAITEEQLQLQQEKKEVEESIQQKTAELQELIIQQLGYKNLLQSKMRLSLQHQSSTEASAPIHLPFIAVRTSKNTVITHSTSKDKLEHVFNFDQPFQIHDNMEVLKRMGMAFGLETNTCSQKNLGILKTMVSKELYPYLEAMVVKGRSLQNHKKIPE